MIQKQFYRELLNYDGEAKQAASLSAILAADAVISALFFQDGNQLTVEEICSIMTKKTEVDANIRALRWVQEFIAVNNNKFDTDNYGQYRSEVWGRYDKENWYIIKSVFDREMQSAGFNSKSFLAWAKRNELLITDKTRRTKNAMVNGTVVPTVCLKIQDCLVIAEA